MSKHPEFHLSFPLLLVAGALLLLNSGCSSTRRAGSAELRERSPEYLMRQLAANQVKAEWMEARAKIDYDDGSLAIGATATIRLRRDSVLWVVVRKLGFEVARALVRPDSVFVLDRLNNEYYAKDLNYITQEYQLPADFQILQAIVLGNPVFFMNKGFQVELSPTGEYHLFGQRDAMENHYWMSGSPMHLQRMVFDDRELQRRLQLQLAEYGQTAEDEKFSYLRNLELNSRNTGKVQIDIRFSQVEFNVPKNIKFEVPERYTRVD